MSLAATSLLLSSVPASYEARTLLTISAGSFPSALPSWIKQSVSPQEFYVTQTAPTPEQAVMKANRLASFFVQKSQPRTSEPKASIEKDVPRLSESELESIQKQIQKLEDDLKKTPAPTPVDQNQKKESDGLTQTLKENPETVLPSEQVDQLGVAKGEYLSYQASLREHRRMAKIYGPLHPKWAAQKSRESSQRTQFLTALDRLDSQSVTSVPIKTLPSVDPSAVQKQIDFLRGLLAQEQEKQAIVLPDVEEKPSRSEAPRITQFAILPEHPIFPKWPETFALAALLSLLAGGIVVAYDRRYRRNFLGPEELEEELGIACFGSLSGRNILREEPADTVLRASGTEIIAKVKALRTVLNMLGTREGKKPKVFLIAEDSPSFSTALLAVWLGRLATRSGEKVLLIDADFHQANVSKLLKLNPPRTLPDYLAGQGRIEDVLDRSTASDLHLIAATKVPHSAADLLSSDRMKNLIRSFSQFYDTVIIVAPAGSRYPEGLALAGLADQVLLCVVAQTSSRKAFRALVRPLLTLGFKNACSVFLEDFPSGSPTGLV
jgi:Mrp family chromosome partitioning ATPase